MFNNNNNNNNNKLSGNNNNRQVNKNCVIYIHDEKNEDN